jgi:chromosome segregation ATPase
MGVAMFKRAENELRPISENPRFTEAQQKLARFQGEIAAARKAINEINDSWYRAQQVAGGDDAIQAADQMIDGGAADAGDARTQLPALIRKMEVLRPAAMRQNEVVDQIRGELSAEAGKIVQARHRTALAKILEAARHLAEVAAAERGIRGQLLELGYQPLDTFTPAPRFAIPFSMGDESWFDSPISYFRRQLQELGIEG